MGKRLMNILIIFLTIFLVLGFIWRNNIKKEVLTGKTFRQTIDVKLNNIFNSAKKNISRSSNSDAYINGLEHNQDYSYIISLGENSLKYMLERFAESNADGIEEYIMASACSEIIKQNPYTGRWNTGREWYDNYIKFVNNNPYATGNHELVSDPKYKSNKDKPLSAFLAKKEILERIDKYQTKEKKQKRVSLELKTYKEHIFQDDPYDYNLSFQIDPDRMVWVLVTKYPKGLDTRTGFFENATGIIVLDGESGDLLKTAVHGDRTKSYSH